MAGVGFNKATHNLSYKRPGRMLERIPRFHVIEIRIDFYKMTEFYGVILNIVGAFVAYNFQTAENKIKLLTKCEIATQNVVLFIETMQQIAKQLQYTRPSFHVTCPSDIQFPSKCSPAFVV
jgi:hypothetical protein